MTKKIATKEKVTIKIKKAKVSQVLTIGQAKVKIQETKPQVLPVCIYQDELFSVSVMKRDDEMTRTEFMNSGRVIGEIHCDDGRSEIEKDLIIIALRK